jgi:hypothetical protein
VSVLPQQQQQQTAGQPSQNQRSNTSSVMQPQALLDAQPLSRHRLQGHESCRSIGWQVKSAAISAAAKLKRKAAAKLKRKEEVSAKKKRKGLFPIQLWKCLYV